MKNLQHLVVLTFTHPGTNRIGVAQLHWEDQISLEHIVIDMSDKVMRKKKYAINK